MNNNEILQDFWQNYQWPEFQPVIYRLYYNEDGSPRAYSVQQLPGDWIEISQADYARMSHLVRVRDGKLVHLSSTPHRRLRPTPGGTPCHPQDITVIVHQHQEHIAWSMQTHEN